MAKKPASTGQITTSVTGKKTFIMDASAFRALGGERFEGLNILKLGVGEAAGDLEVTKIGVQKVKGRGKEKGKTREIPSYSLKAPDGREYRAPINKSFVMKAEEAKVAVGDIIAIMRGDDYVSKDDNKGTSYELVVQKRA